MFDKWCVRNLYNIMCTDLNLGYLVVRITSHMIIRHVDCLGRLVKCWREFYVCFGNVFLSFVRSESSDIKRNSSTKVGCIVDSSSGVSSFECNMLCNILSRNSDMHSNPS